MTSGSWGDMSELALVSAYRDAAAEHGRRSAGTDYVGANEQARIVRELYSELRLRGIAAQTALLELLGDDDLHVQQWVAAHALDFAAEEGVSTLERLAKLDGAVGLNATMTLREWRSGRLQL